MGPIVADGPSATIPRRSTIGHAGSGWLGVGAPKNRPADIIDTPNKAINAGLADPELKSRLASLGVIPGPMAPADFAKFIATETEKWGKVVKFADIKPK